MRILRALYSKLSLFSNPETWNVDSSQKQTRFKNPGPESNLSSIVTANSFRLFWLKGLAVIAHYMHKAASFYAKFCK